MKSLRHYLRQCFDKGAVLAVGFGCLYIYEQQYKPDIFRPLSYGIITVGAIGYTSGIIKDVQASIENKEYQKLLQILDEQKSEILVNRVKFNEVRDICQSLLVNKELLEEWRGEKSLVLQRIALLKRLLKIQNRKIPLQDSHGNQDPNEIWTSFTRKGIFSKEIIEKLSREGDQRSIFPCTNIKSFGSFLCRAYDKGVILAAGVCCLYLYGQKYISNVPTTVPYGIITAGAIGFIRYILQHLDTPTVPQGSTAEDLKVIVRKEIAEILKEQIAENVQGEIPENMQEEKSKEEVDEKLVQNASQEMEQEEPKSRFRGVSAEKFMEISQRKQRELMEFVDNAIDEKRESFENPEQEISDDDYMEIMFKASREMMRRSREMPPGTVQGVSSESAQDLKEKRMLEFIKRSKGRKNIQQSIAKKAKSDISEKEQDAVEIKQELMTAKKEEESQMMPKENVLLVGEKVPEFLQPAFAEMEENRKKQEREFVTVESQPFGEKYLVLENEESEAVGKAEFENAGKD